MCPHKFGSTYKHPYKRTHKRLYVHFFWSGTLYGRNQSGWGKNVGLLPFILFSFFTIYIFVALMKISMHFKQLEASYIMG